MYISQSNVVLDDTYQIFQVRKFYKRNSPKDRVKKILNFQAQAQARARAHLSHACFELVQTEL